MGNHVVTFRNLTRRSGDLMTVTARVWGAHGDREFLLVIDTGATVMIIPTTTELRLHGAAFSMRMRRSDDRIS